MTTAAITDHARPLVLQRDGACLREVVARRHASRRNPARMTPRSTLRTLTNRSRHHAQRWVRKVGRSITNSETPHNVLGVFQGLGLTYTRAGIELDRLTHTQRRVLELLQITPPWPEQTPTDLTLS